MSHSSLKQPSQEETYDTPYWRTLIRCPLMGNCDQRIELAEINNHCCKKHSATMFHDRFFHTLKFGTANIVLLIKNNQTFIIYLFNYLGDLRIVLFSIGAPRGCSTYKVKLFKNGFREKSLVFNDEFPILQFDDDKHCPRCIFGLQFNESRCHEGFEQISQIWALPKIPDEVANQLWNDFTCEIDIEEVSPPPYHSLVSDIRKWYSCIVCMELMEGKLIMCENEHTQLCQNCADRVNRCPTCNGSMTSRRNYKLEDMGESLVIPCVNESKGCNFKDKLNNLRAHEAHCRHQG